MPTKPACGVIGNSDSELRPRKVNRAMIPALSAVSSSAKVAASPSSEAAARTGQSDS